VASFKANSMVTMRTQITRSIAILGLLGTASASAFAQDSSNGNSDDYVEALRSCQSLNDDAARLACFDSAVANIVTANDEGEVQVVDREDVRETRRSLFGFSLPRIGLFGGDDENEEESERLETTIASVRYLGRGAVRFTTAEGAVWEMNNVPRRMRTINAGDSVEFRKATLGYFFVRINGQRGVKGKRVE